MQRGIDSLAQKAASGKGIRVVIDLPNASNVTKMILGNPTTDTVYLGVNANAYGGTSAGLTYSGQRQGILKEFLGGARDTDVYEPDTSIAHCRLFSQTRSGYISPWLSLDLGVTAEAPKYLADWQSQFQTPDEGSFDPGERVSTIVWSEAVYRRAMSLRIFDLMIGQFFPAVKGGALAALGAPPDQWTTYGGYFPYSGPRYSYHSPLYGDVWESVYPPFPGEDVNIVKEGVKLDFHGRPIDPTARFHEIGTVQGAAATFAQAQLNALPGGQPLENFSPMPTHVALSQPQLTAAAQLSPTILNPTPANVAPSVAIVSNPPVSGAPTANTYQSRTIASVRASLFSRYS
jgi:hypothetical protein